MKNKLTKVLIINILILVALIFKQKVYAVTTNYDEIKTKENYIVMQVKAEDNTNITDELIECIKCANNEASSENKVLIYIPSGTYFLEDSEQLAVHSYTTIVAEDDTIIKKTENSSNRILKIRSSEKVTDILIYGGVWDGMNLANFGMDIDNAENLTLQKLTIKNCTQNGINEKNNSIVSVIDCKIESNSKHGISVYQQSNLTIKNSIIQKNKNYGIYIENATLFANSNTISYNDWTGITANNSSTKIEVKDSKIYQNGQNPKGTDEGQLGHGIAVQMGANAVINNNYIYQNKVCGISVTTENATAKITNNQIYQNGRHGIGARIQANLTVTGNNIYSNSYNGILVADRSNSVIQNNTIKSSSKFGLSLADNSTATLDGNTISNNTGSNISVSGKASTLTLTKNNKINESKTNNGINLSDYASLKITGSNNTINSNKGHGISVTSKNVNLNISGAGNVVNKNGKSGIFVDKGKTIKITGKTTFKNNKKSGIVIYGAKATVKNIISDGNKEFGVAIREKANVTLTNSTIKNNKNYGIYIVDSGTNAKIEKNNITGNKNAGINVDKKAKVSSIYKNTLNKNGDKAIRICGSAVVKSIKKNTIKKHATYGIYIKKAKATTIKSNKFTGIKKKNQIYK